MQSCPPQDPGPERPSSRRPDPAPGGPDRRDWWASRAKVHLQRGDGQDVAILAHLALLALVNQPPTNAEDLGIEPYGDTPPIVESLVQTKERVDERMMKGHWLEGLVSLENLSVGLRADGISAARNVYEGPASIVLSGDLAHAFDGDITDVRAKMVFVTPEENERAWRRMNISPLDLTDSELNERLPRPVFVFEQSLKDRAYANVPETVSAAEDFDDLAVPVGRIPHYLGLVTSYKLVNPTINDLRRVVNRGNVADFTALTHWLEAGEARSMAFTPSERRALIDEISGKLRGLRAPPGPGDFRRIHGMLGLILEFGRPDDLETLLKLNRPMTILLMSAALSHEAAQSEEGVLELPIHGLRSLPSGNRLIDGFQRALRRVRLSALPKLLEFALRPTRLPRTQRQFLAVAAA